MAEVLLAQRLRSLGVPATVRSAGELAGGVPASPGSVRAMTRRGFDIKGHLSATVTAEMLERADLVIAMSRRHLRNAVVLAPDCFGRAFTLKELVRRAEAVDERAPSETVADWLARVHDGRSIRDMIADDPRDDVDDPMGSPDHCYEATAVELESLFDRLVKVGFAAARRESA
jgi:protein-tyrosine phosphatase